jgi:hypothetical protein
VNSSTITGVRTPATGSGVASDAGASLGKFSVAVVCARREVIVAEAAMTHKIIKTGIKSFISKSPFQRIMFIALYTQACRMSVKGLTEKNESFAQRIRIQYGAPALRPPGAIEGYLNKPKRLRLILIGQAHVYNRRAHMRQIVQVLSWSQ